jgi:hypothetical protein
MHTHSAKNPRHLQHKIELCAAGDFTSSFCGLQCLQLHLGEEQCETRVIVERLPNLCNGTPCTCYVIQRSLEEMSAKRYLISQTQLLTTNTRTARSLRCSIQKAQLASHRLPSLKAIGMTVDVRMFFKMGPSSPCSPTLANATASWKSCRFLMHTLTVSFRLPPSRKKAAAYSEDLYVIIANLDIWRTYQTCAYSVEQKHS